MFYFFRAAFAPLHFAKTGFPHFHYRSILLVASLLRWTASRVLQSLPQAAATNTCSEFFNASLCFAKTRSTNCLPTIAECIALSHSSFRSCSELLCRCSNLCRKKTRHLTYYISDTYIGNSPVFTAV